MVSLCLITRDQKTIVIPIKMGCNRFWWRLESTERPISLYSLNIRCLFLLQSLKHCLLYLIVCSWVPWNTWKSEALLHLSNVGNDQCLGICGTKKLQTWMKQVLLSWACDLMVVYKKTTLRFIFRHRKDWFLLISIGRRNLLVEKLGNVFHQRTIKAHGSTRFRYTWASLHKLPQIWLFNWLKGLFSQNKQSGAEDFLDKKLCCINSIHSGLGGNEVSHPCQTAHHLYNEV